MCNSGCWTSALHTTGLWRGVCVMLLASWDHVGACRRNACVEMSSAACSWVPQLMTDNRLHCMIWWPVEFALLARVVTYHMLPANRCPSLFRHEYRCYVWVWDFPCRKYDRMGVARQMAGQACCDEAVPPTPANAHICVSDRHGAADDSMQHRAVSCSDSDNDTEHVGPNAVWPPTAPACQLHPAHHPYSCMLCPAAQHIMQLAQSYPPA